MTDFFFLMYLSRAMWAVVPCPEPEHSSADGGGPRLGKSSGVGARHQLGHWRRRRRTRPPRALRPAEEVAVALRGGRQRGPRSEHERRDGRFAHFAGDADRSRPGIHVGDAAGAEETQEDVFHVVRKWVCLFNCPAQVVCRVDKTIPMGFPLFFFKYCFQLLYTNTGCSGSI